MAEQFTPKSWAQLGSQSGFSLFPHLPNTFVRLVVLLSKVVSWSRMSSLEVLQVPSSIEHGW